jgi:hypothetical protein
MTHHIAVLVSIFAVACSSSSEDSAREYIAAVTTVDGSASARFVGGAPPSGAGPQVMISTNASVIPGGTARVRLAADRGFSTAIIGIAGVDGYYELTLPSAATAELLVTLSQQLDVDSFEWAMSVGGPVATSHANVVNVGTGDVQVSLSWNTTADVDLHVVDPSGEEILYLNRMSASGGELDLDSNAGCSDGPRNENITWPAGAAPAGTYRVLVDYWSSCEAPSTPYTVTINVKGREVQTFTGTFTGEGDYGGYGDGLPITTFSSTAGAARQTRMLGEFHVEPGARVYMK